MAEKLPIFVLAGSDAHPGVVPPELTADQMLRGNKGIRRLAEGSLITAELIDRIRRSGCFAEPVIVGPRDVYAGNLDAQVVHAQGSLAGTLRTFLHAAQQRCGLGEPVAVISYDILPTVEELRRCVEAEYHRSRKALFWWQMIQADPSELGASVWKPSYRFRLAADGPLANLYPGHFAVLQPAAIRMELAAGLLKLAYRYRNVALHKRVFPLLWGALMRLMVEDLRNLRRLHAPVLSGTLPCRAMRIYTRFRKGEATLTELEQGFASLLLHRSARQAAADRAVVISVTRMLSFAKDIDTQEELREAVSGLERDARKPASDDQPL